MLHVGCAHLIADSAPSSLASITDRAARATAARSGGSAAMYSSMVACRAISSRLRWLEQRGLEPGDPSFADLEAVPSACGTRPRHRLTEPLGLHHVALDVEALHGDAQPGRRLWQR